MAIDHVLKLLNQYGYNNLLQHQEVVLAPLDVLGRDDVLERLGSVTTLFRSTIDPPVEVPPVPAASLEGTLTDNIPVSIGRRLLVNSLNGIGSHVQIGQLPAFDDAIRFLRFVSTGTTMSAVHRLAIDKYLRGAQALTTQTADRYLLNREADAFVVTDVIQSDTVSVRSLDVRGETVPLDIPILQGALGGDVKVEAGSLGVHSVTMFRGPRRATIAFRCFRITRTAGQWEVSGRNGSVDDRPMLIAPGTRVRVYQPGGVAASSA